MDNRLIEICNMLSCVKANGDQHTGYKIKETDPSASLKTLHVSAYNGDWFIFDPDRGRGSRSKKDKVMSPLLVVSNAYDHHRACDGVILAMKEEKLYAVFIELKSSHPSSFVGQLKSTRCFVNYLLALAKEFKNISLILEERFVVFHTPERKKRNLAKLPTTLRKALSLSKNPNKPTKQMINDGDTVYLDALLS